MTDIWVCSTCHSINRQRVTRCYKCGGSRDEATGEGSELRVEQALASRTIVSYRSAWLRGGVAAILILAVAALGIVILLASLDDVGWIRDQLALIVRGGTLDAAEYARRTQGLLPAATARFVLAVAALLFFGAWLSRVVMNIPALGGGVPSTTPTKAFVYPLIPVWNLVKVPGMIQDTLYRVDPQAGGFFLVALAWFGLVGSWIISVVAGWVIRFQVTSDLGVAKTDAEVAAALQRGFNLVLALTVLTELLVAGGAIVLVMVMIRIERRSAARDREIRAAALATPNVWGPPTGAQPESVPSSASPRLAPSGIGVATAAAYVPLQRFLPTAQTLEADQAPTMDVPGSLGMPATEATVGFHSAAAAEAPGFDGSPAHDAVPALDTPGTAEAATIDGSAAASATSEAPEAEPATRLAEPAKAVESAEVIEAIEPTEVTESAEPAEASVEAKPPARTRPHLAVVVHGDGRIIATVDSDPEQITLEELALVAEALAQAAGTAAVTAADEAAATNDVLEMAERTLRDQGVAMTTAPSDPQKSPVGHP